MLDNNKFKKQADIIILLLMLWAIICTAMFFYYSVIAKDKYIKLGNKLARRELLYYPERSRILDKNGIVLAWSEKYYDLYYNNLTGSSKKIEIIYERVKNEFPDAKKPSPDSIRSLMLRALRPKQVLALEHSIYLYQELQITPRIERKVVEYPIVQTYVGQVKLVDGQLVGISGLEKTYNKTLSGIPGKYQIMLDRNKNWIKNSGKSIRLAAPGKDIKLALSLEDIRKGKK
jgi:cell division protein FtsI/penicillin-binding protein 2